MLLRMKMSLFKTGTRLLPLLVSVVFLSPIAVISQTNVEDITCQDGNGEYKTEFSTGITVDVGPIRKGEFAERACSAKLSLKGQEVSVADDASEIGVDVLGADLGFGRPVVAFQVDKSGSGSNRTYQIYSLTKPAHLLYALSGGDSYSASDTDVDGRVEIWTDDAAAVDGFEGVPKGSFDFAPTVVLRFEKRRFVNVGSEFVSHYDALISKTRAQVTQSDLDQFKKSDGRQSGKLLLAAEDLHREMRTKISILEIVWEYVYSGREQKAWSVLNEMWPAADAGRIHSAISDLHNRGILRNLDRSRETSPHKKHAKIYDAIVNSDVVSGFSPYGGAPLPAHTESLVVQPKSILLRRPPPSPDGPVPSANETIELVVDAAGKVRSATTIGGTDKPLVNASSGWHFVPAFRDGLPVACRFRLSVWALK